MKIEMKGFDSAKTMLLGVNVHSSQSGLGSSRTASCHVLWRLIASPTRESSLRRVVLCRGMNETVIKTVICREGR